jgi:hypothetical protein
MKAVYGSLKPELSCPAFLAAVFLLMKISLYQLLLRNWAVMALLCALPDKKKVYKETKL